jgi:hypothetical protein
MSISVQNNIYTACVRFASKSLGKTKETQNATKTDQPERSQAGSYWGKRVDETKINQKSQKCEANAIR